jgi:hypothetical protein
MLRAALAGYDQMIGLEPDDLSVDGAITKARAEGEVAAREFVEHRGEADPNATCGSRRPAYCA